MFQWDDSFMVFYNQIDSEHQKLFQMISDCDADRGNAGKLTALYEFVVEHFTYEEGEMQAAKYEPFPGHKKIHEEFLAKLRTLKTPLDEGNMNFAKDWLVGHIKGVDFKYKGKLQC